MATWASLLAARRRRRHAPAAALGVFAIIAEPRHSVDLGGALARELPPARGCSARNSPGCRGWAAWPGRNDSGGMSLGAGKGAAGRPMPAICTSEKASASEPAPSHWTRGDAHGTPGGRGAAHGLPQRRAAARRGPSSAGGRSRLEKRSARPPRGGIRASVESKRAVGPLPRESCPPPRKIARSKLPGRAVRPAAALGTSKERPGKPTPGRAPCPVLCLAQAPRRLGAISTWSRPASGGWDVGWCTRRFGRGVEGKALGGCVGARNLTPPFISAAPQVGVELTATRGEWSGEVKRVELKWVSCAVEGSACAVRAEGERYAPVASDVGRVLRVVAVAMGGGPPGTRLPGRPGAEPAPAIVSPRESTARPRRGDPLGRRCDWEGSVETVSLEWLRCEPGGSARRRGGRERPTR
jgi:hypothetical protein